MIKEGKYTVSELMVAIKESTKNEFKPKLGDKVESDNKKNNGEAVKDITKEVEKYNPDGIKHDVVLPADRNKTTLDLKFNELEPGKEWRDRVEAQVHGFPSVENEKNSKTKDNESLDYEGNKEFADHQKELDKERKQVMKDDMDAGLKGRELKKYNVVNENFDFEDDNMVTADMVAKDFIKWATEEADKGHNYPMNAMALVVDAYKGDEDALEDLVAAYEETRGYDMMQHDTIRQGIEKAINAYGYYNLSHGESDDEIVNEDNTVANNTFSGQNEFSRDSRVNASKFAHDGADADVARKDQDRMHKNEKNRKRYSNKQLDNIASKPLGLNKDINEDGNVVNEGAKSNTMKRLNFKSKIFLSENDVLRYIPESYKTDGNKFFVKDASGTQYLVECEADKQFGFMKVNIVNKLNEEKEKDQLERMKRLYNYSSSNYTKSSDKGTENMQRLHEDISKIKGLSNPEK